MFSPSGMILLKKPINHLFWLCAHVHPQTGYFCTCTDSRNSYHHKNNSSLQIETLKHHHALESGLSSTEIDKLEVDYYTKFTDYKQPPYYTEYDSKLQKLNLEA